jgi:hypothetical protein
MKKQRSPQTKTYAPARSDEKPGPDSAGQSGDTQGLTDIADADSESVRELLEEGQSFEAEAVMGVENVPDADVSEVRVKQVREDDVPQEYLDQENDH